MIRILHVNSTIKKNSGVMSVIMNYYNNINRDNIQFDFLSFFDDVDDKFTYKEDINRNGGRTYKVNPLNNPYLFLREFEEMIKQHHGEYDIVHIHDAFVAPFAYKMLKRNGIKKVIIHSHATKWSDKKLSAVRNRLLCRRLEHNCDSFFACSKAAGNFMFGKGAEFYLMNNAIDVSRYQYNAHDRNALRAEMKLEDYTVIGHVGNFVNQKNHVFLLEIFGEILKHNPICRLMLVGDGPLRGAIESQAKEKGIYDNILFLGKRSDVESLYQVMDVFVLPSLYEGLPMVGVEAQCASLPVVFSDTITKEVGIFQYSFLSLQDSVNIWAKRILEMVRKSERNEQTAIEQIRKKGFDICQETKNLEEKYKTMI